jgi:hypothetical protein
MLAFRTKVKSKKLENRSQLDQIRMAQLDESLHEQRETLKVT